MESENISENGFDKEFEDSIQNIEMHSALEIMNECDNKQDYIHVSSRIIDDKEDNDTNNIAMDEDEENYINNIGMKENEDDSNIIGMEENEDDVTNSIGIQDEEDEDDDDTIGCNDIDEMNTLPIEECINDNEDDTQIAISSNKNFADLRKDINLTSLNAIYKKDSKAAHHSSHHIGSYIYIFIL